MQLTEMARAMAHIAETFTLAPFETILQPLIDQTLQQLGKEHYRKGTVLIPRFLVWLVLALTLRRDLSYDNVLNWLVSGFRWVSQRLPAQAKVLSDGAVSHARSRPPVELRTGLGLRCSGSFLGSMWPRFLRGRRIFMAIVALPSTERRRRCPIPSRTCWSLANRVHGRVLPRFPSCV